MSRFLSLAILGLVALAFAKTAWAGPVVTSREAADAAAHHVEQADFPNTVPLILSYGYEAVTAWGDTFASELSSTIEGSRTEAAAAKTEATAAKATAVADEGKVSTLESQVKTLQKEVKEDHEALITIKGILKI